MFAANRRNDSGMRGPMVKVTEGLKGLSICVANHNTCQARACQARACQALGLIWGRALVGPRAHIEPRAPWASYEPQGPLGTRDSQPLGVDVNASSEFRLFGSSRGKEGTGQRKNGAGRGPDSEKPGPGGIQTV